MIPQYKRFHGFIVVYDVSEKNSFINSKLCFEEILENCKIENQNVAFVGNKIDLKRTVPYEEANDYCLEKDIYYVETSAKNSSQIKKIIERIAKDLICSGKVKTSTSIAEPPLRSKMEEVFALRAEQLKNLKTQSCFKKFLGKIKNLFAWI